MRIDHIAYRVSDRKATAKFFCEAMDYRLGDEFTIDFGGGQTAQCLVLIPPEKRCEQGPWTSFLPLQSDGCEMHLPPEIFISDGSPGSIVADWVAARAGIGGIHHIAYQVKSVEQTMVEWKGKGFAEFTSEEPMRCPGLTQVFTKPSVLTGVIFEFIERGLKGFCRDNVKQLMESTRDIDEKLA